MTAGTIRSAIEKEIRTGGEQKDWRCLAVTMDPRKLQHGVAEAFGQDNETTVAKVVWLSEKDNGKAYGSMVVYLTKAADVRKFLEEGFFYAGGESGYTRLFERRDRPEQCYECQQVGHKAWKTHLTFRLRHSAQLRVPKRMGFGLPVFDMADSRGGTAMCCRGLRGP
ncbi:hypothetical protein PG996_011065 [Apiospora saccharicola]|uniref:Uncharacterized protein n=1 Tax=Apiospora saccharicola TaxID=335842 RepID=A0ABR1UDZ6_9PEZI